MDFLEYYTESLDEELGTGAGFADAIDKIGKHPHRTGKSANKSAIGLPKDVWNTSPPSSSYRGNMENYNKMRKLQAQIKKLLQDQEQKFVSQAKDEEPTPAEVQQGNLQPQSQQAPQQPANVPQNLQTQRDKAKARHQHARYTVALKKYDAIIDDFNRFIEQFNNAFEVEDPEELNTQIGQLEAALKINKHGMEGVNDAASEVYRFLEKDMRPTFSRIHKALKESMDLEYNTLDKVIKNFKEAQEQKRLEAEKEKQDAENQAPEPTPEPEADGFQADPAPERVVTDKSSISNIIKNKPSTKSDDELKAMIQKVKDLNPSLEDQDLSDEEIMDLIRAERERQQKDLTPVESVSFSEFYALNEVGPGQRDNSGGTLSRMAGQAIDNQANSPYLLNRLAGRAAQKILPGVKNLMNKPKKTKPTVTVNEFPQGMDKNRFFAVNYAGYTAANAACGKSLTEYRTYAKENGLGAAKKLGQSLVMVYQRDNVSVEGDVKGQIDPFYKFQPDVNTIQLIEGTIWRTTNQGYVFTMSGQINNADEDVNARAEISQDEKENIRYFVGCDAKGLEFFADNFHMSMRQYLQNARTSTPATISKELEAMDANLATIAGGNTKASTQQIPAPTMYAKKFTDNNKITIVKKNIEDYIKRYRNDIAKQEPISKPNAQGFKVKFTNGEGITYMANDMGQFIVNLSDAIIMNDIESIDPDGITGYTKV